MTKEERNRFAALRRKVEDYINKALEEDPCHKSYEGAWELHVLYPGVFESEVSLAEPNSYEIVLHCYLIGPHSHYTWDGKTWADALDKCEKDIDCWTKDASEDDA